MLLQADAKETYRHAEENLATWLITGSNGNLGAALIQALLREPDEQIVAVVRSDRAATEVAAGLGEAQCARVRIETLSYTDVSALKRVAEGVDCAVHLVGILKETASATYQDAHENSTKALLEGLAGSSCAHLTYLSIVGSRPDAANACLRSKGNAEALLREAALPACVLRVPMVLGPGDYASAALGRRARSARSFGFRMSSLEQPIFAGDVVQAVMQAARLRLDESLDFGGPEVLSRADLTRRAAQVLGNTTSVVSLPVAVGYLMAGLLGLGSNPPVTRDMLEVLDHDDNVDPAPALAKLQMPALTSLDDTLRAVLAPET